MLEGSVRVRGSFGAYGQVIIIHVNFGCSEIFNSVQENFVEAEIRGQFAVDVERGQRSSSCASTVTALVPSACTDAAAAAFTYCCYRPVRMRCANVFY